jgi:hypothetical protein
MNGQFSEMSVGQELKPDERLTKCQHGRTDQYAQETVLLLLQEVESLTIAAPAGLKSGARLNDEVRNSR